MEYKAIYKSDTLPGGNGFGYVVFDVGDYYMIREYDMFGCFPVYPISKKCKNIKDHDCILEATCL